MRRFHFLFFIFILLSMQLFSGEYKTGNSIRITDSIKTDLYAASDYFSISAPVRGDVWAGVGKALIENTSANNVYIAASDIFINDAKLTSAILMAGNIKFQGSISGGLKAAGGTVFINGLVERDLIVAGGKIVIERNAVIKGDVIGAGGSLEIYGNVEGNLKGSFGNFELYGKINKDVSVNVDEKFFIDESAHIGGNLCYKSKKEFDFNKSLVGGAINFERRTHDRFKFENFIWAFKLFISISALIAAFVLVALTRRKLQSFLKVLDQTLFITLAIGGISVIAVPIILVFLFGLIITIPLGFLMLFLSCILFFVGKLFFAVYIGDKLLYLINKKEANIFLSTLLGVVVMYGLFFIPYLGIVFYLVASIWGFGIGCKFVQHLFMKEV